MTHSWNCLFILHFEQVVVLLCILRPVLHPLVLIAFEKKFPMASSTVAASQPKPLQITQVRTFVIQGVGSGGDYHNVNPRQLVLHVVKSAELNRSKAVIGS